jgi:hypothetical protein
MCSREEDERLVEVEGGDENSDIGRQGGARNRTALPGGFGSREKRYLGWSK